MTLSPPPVPTAEPPETIAEHHLPAVPGGATDPLWYLAARNLAPHMETTRKGGWIEGFVACMEVLRGVDNEPLADVLRESLRLDLVPPDHID